MRHLADAARRVDDDDVGDDDVAGLAHRGGLQQQSVAGGLAEAGQELVAALLRVVLDLDDEAGVAEAHAVAHRGTVDRGVVVGQDLVGVARDCAALPPPSSWLCSNCRGSAGASASGASAAHASPPR